MATDLSICNAALNRIGAEPISDLSDNNKRAKLCNAHYARVRDELLAEHPWHFALKQVKISPTGTTPTLDYTQEFDVPADYLRAYLVSPDYIEYKRVGDVFLADENELSLTYIAETAEADFAVWFTATLILKLAVELSYSMVQSNELHERLLKNYEDALRNARLYNAQEGTPGSFVATAITDVRY